jgi:hypothetical protein
MRKATKPTGIDHVTVYRRGGRYSEPGDFAQKSLKFLPTL